LQGSHNPKNNTYQNEREETSDIIINQRLSNISVYQISAFIKYQRLSNISVYQMFQINRKKTSVSIKIYQFDKK
jgi:hypothetical protein